ncbi:MAG: extracellular solute-binding protein, partial [Lachnospiraceae bacterium]|nr:extracellular solute-binding protein [Lachnospiraceae bacterium]
MKKKLISKKLISTILASALVLSAAGCGNGSTGTEALDKGQTETESAGVPQNAEQTAPEEGEGSGETVKITLMTRYGDDTDVNAATFRKAVAAFAEEYPEIQVEDLSITDETQYNNMFKTYMATDDVPTIFMTYGGGNLQSYVENGIAADLKTYLEADSEWHNSFNSTMFSMLTFDNMEGVYGIPYAAYVDSLFVNKALFEEHGIGIPATIEELEEACEAFLAKGITPLPVGDKSTFRGGHLFTLLMAKRTGEDLVKKLAGGEVSYDCDEVRDVLTTMKNWADKGYLGNSITTLDGEGEAQLFLTGQSPMIYRNASFISRIVNEMEDNSEVIEMNFPYYEDYPQYANMWHGGSSDAFSIAAGATEEQKEAAIALLKYVTRMEYMIERNE